MTDKSGQEFNLATERPCNQLSGQFGVHKQPQRGETTRKLISVSLDELIPSSEQRIEYLKIDVEGFEPKVMAGATLLFARQAVRAASMESIWRTKEQRGEMVVMLSKLYDYRYIIGCLQTGEWFSTADKWLKWGQKFKTNGGCQDIGIELKAP